VPFLLQTRFCFFNFLCKLVGSRMNAAVAKEQVEAKLSSGLLMKPSALFRETLGMAADLDPLDFKSLVIKMYQLAAAKENWVWVTQAQREAKSFFQYEWILANMPHKDPSLNQVSCSTLVQEDWQTPTNQDIRLLADPNLPVVRVDMGACSGQGVGMALQNNLLMETGEDYGPNAVEGNAGFSGCQVSKTNIQSKKKYKKTSCSFPGCTALINLRERDMKGHARRCHIPFLFWMTLKPEELVLPAIQAGRAELLELLALWIVGSASVDGLVERMGAYGNLGAVSTPEIWPEFQALCRFKGWPVPSEFRFDPLNSPACLLHWRCLMVLLGALPIPRYEEFVRRSQGFRKTPNSKKRKRSTAIQLPGPGALTITVPNLRTHGWVSDPSPSVIVVPSNPVPAEPSGVRGEMPVLDQMPPAPEVEYSDRELPAPEVAYSDVDQMYAVIDSHMHLDRMNSQLRRGTPVHTLGEIRSLRVRAYPEVRVDLRGVVAVHCDPETYPNRICHSDEVKVAIGLHPRKVELFDVTRENLFASLIQNPAVVALGEVGFDLTEPSRTWDTQLTVLRRVLSYCSVSKPLVLHIRSNPYQVTFNPYEKVFEIVQDYCGRLQPIHLHCFGGTAEDVEPWRQTFPNCYFGFTFSVDFFSGDQVQGLKKVPLERILLETDSPYLSPRGRSCVNTPMFLGDVGLLVARRKGVSFLDLMRNAYENTRTLYKFK